MFDKALTKIDDKDLLRAAVAIAYLKAAISFLSHSSVSMQKVI